MLSAAKKLLFYSASFMSSTSASASSMTIATVGSSTDAFRRLNLTFNLDAFPAFENVIHLTRIADKVYSGTIVAVGFGNRATIGIMRVIASRFGANLADNGKKAVYLHPNRVKTLPIRSDITKPMDYISVVQFYSLCLNNRRLPELTGSLLLLSLRYSILKYSYPEMSSI